MLSLSRKKDKGLRCLEDKRFYSKYLALFRLVMVENSDLFDECICGNNLSFLILGKKK